MLSFLPQSEEEVSNLLKPGTYDFEVRKAENKVSKAGNPMIALTLILWDSAGRERIVYDYLMPSMMYKLKHFCDAVGLEDKYNLGKFTPEDCLNKTGKCKIRIDEKEGFSSKNSVQDYVKKCTDDLNVSTIIAKPTEEFNDDIPF